MILLTDKIKSDVPRGFYYFEKKAYLYTAAFWKLAGYFRVVYTNSFGCEYDIEPPVVKS